MPGLNSARNTGIAARRAPIRRVRRRRRRGAAAAGCASCVDGPRAGIPRRSCFGGPIRLRLEGPGCRCAAARRRRSRRSTAGPRTARSRSSGAPTWASTARAFELAGTFDAGVPYGFDEDMWERRLRAARRPGRCTSRAPASCTGATPRDARLRPLMRAAYRRGRGAARLHRASRARRPAAPRELRVLAGCVWHIFRCRCGERPAADRALRRPRARDARAMSGDRVRPRARALGRERDRRRAARARLRGARCATSPTTRPRGCALAAAARRGARRDRLPRRSVLRARHLRAGRRCDRWRARSRSCATQPPRRAVRARRARRAPTAALAAETRARRPARRGQVREPERAAGGGAAAATPTGCSWSTTTSSCRAASWTGSWPAPSASASSSPSRRCATRATPPGRSCGARAGRVARRTRLVEIGPLTAFHRSVAGRAAAVPAAADGMGARRALGRRWRSSAAGASGSSTRPRSATSRAARRAATTATPRSRKLRTSCADRPYIDRETRARGRGAAPVAVAPAVSGGGSAVPSLRSVRPLPEPPHLRRCSRVGSDAETPSFGVAAHRTRDVRSANNHDRSCRRARLALARSPSAPALASADRA